MRFLKIFAEEIMKDSSSNVIRGVVAGVLLGAALVSSSYIIAGGFRDIAGNFGSIAKAERVVSVRGLAEREVDADLAVWPLTFSVGDNDMQALQKSLIEKIGAVKDYLRQQGLLEADYTVQAPSITDTTLATYCDNKARYAYVARQTVLVRSKSVGAVKAAQEKSLELMGRNIAVEQDYGSKIQYEYTALNAIKPEMIGEATKNARAAAEQFANDSGSAVGKIRTATQGWFSIDDAAVGLEQKKKVRVVTTVEYILVD